VQEKGVEKTEKGAEKTRIKGEKIYKGEES